jgi:DnaJ domain
MVFFLAGVALLLVLIFGARLLAAADPRKLAGAIRKAGGVAALAVAALLLTRGVLVLAIPLAAFGLGLLAKSGTFGFGGPFASGQKSSGQKSHVRTETLEMELDHDSGSMEGTCLKGRFEGRAFSSLSEPELIELRDELRDAGLQEAALIEAYLDWRVPQWREAHEGASDQRAKARKSSGGMSVEEAYAVLGLKAGAVEEDIRHAHRQLMKKVHPDQGGSTYLAARINEAKEVLLSR